MMFDKIYELPLARSYVRHWGVVEAVRELFQNALDSDSPLEYTLHTDSLTLTSRYAKLEPSTLLLGATSKADDVEKIGSFGEGFKIALLVLLRAGKEVVVLNDGVTWTPEFQHHPMYGAEMLCIRETRNPQHSGFGLTFLVGGLTEEEREDIVRSNLHLWQDVGQTLETSRGRILLDIPGKLYVNGLYVCDTGLKFSYDMKPAHLRLERDRKTVDTFDLKWATKDMWFETRQYEQIATLIAEKVPDLEYANYGTPELVKEACYQLFTSRHPGAVVAKTQAELERLVAAGLQKVIVVHETLYDLVHTSRSYNAREAVVFRSPTQVLEDWFALNRKHMRRDGIVAFKELLAQAKGWKLK